MTKHNGDDFREVLRWPTNLVSAAITIEGVDDKGVRYRLTVPQLKLADGFGVTLVERGPLLTELRAYDPATEIAPPSTFSLEVDGEMVPAEDSSVYTVEVLG